jgi:hypothetical protein
VTARVTACGETPSRCAASLKLRASAAAQKILSISSRFSMALLLTNIPDFGILNSKQIHLLDQSV